MGSFSNYTENKWLGHVLKDTAFTKPTALFLAYSTTDFTEDGSGASEPVGAGYARKTCLAQFATGAATRIISNDGDIVFDQATGSQGTIGYWAVFDAITGGNMLCYGAFAAAKAIGNGQTPKVLTGEIDISIPASNGMTNYLAHEMLDHTFLSGDPGFTVPANLYVGLGTGTFGDTGVFTNEVANSGAYARENVNGWTVTASAAENTGAITFTTATGAWGTVSDHFISDNSAHGTGNMLLYGTLDESKAVVADDVVNYASGTFDITQD